MHEPSINLSTEKTPINQDKTFWQHFVYSVTKNYANFSGRATRKEFWAFQFFHLAIPTIILLVMLLKFILEGSPSNDTGPHKGIFAAEMSLGMLFICIWALCMIIPSISICVRRLHDLGLSGWWLLPIYLLSGLYIGLIGLVYIASTKGQTEDNKFDLSPYPITPNWSFSDKILCITFITLTLMMLFGISEIYIGIKNNQLPTQSLSQNEIINSKSKDKTIKEYIRIQEEASARFFKSLQKE